MKKAWKDFKPLVYVLGGFMLIAFIAIWITDTFCTKGVWVTWV